MKYLPLIILLVITILYVNHLAAQTVPISNTHQLQNGISVGAGLWAEPNALLAGQAAVICAGTAGMTACITANNAIANDAQARALAYMNDVYKNYPNAEASLTNNRLWFKGN